MEIDSFNKSISGKINAVFYKSGVQFFLFVLLIAAILLIRLQVYLNVSLNYIDSDQPFLWAGAIDYAKGIFHEPRFYGQNYNSFFESLIAVPFIWLGLPVYKALPIATQLIFLFPFLFSSIYLFSHQKKTAAFVALVLLMCLPCAFDIMTSLPRGFVTGIFFSSFFVLSFLKPQNLKFLSLNFTMLVLGYFINQNSILISFPFLIYLFQFNHKEKKFYIISICMLILFFVLYLIFDLFYKLNPQYVIYGYEHLFAFKFLVQNITHLDMAFAYLSFFSEGKSWTVLIVFFALGLSLYKTNRKAFIAFMAFLLVLFIGFLSEKSCDGVLWPWYAYSRLYICMPAVLFLFLSILPFKRNGFVLVLLASSLFFFGYKIVTFQQNLKRLTDEKLWNGVHLVSINQALDAIGFYKEACLKQNADLFLISNGFWLNTFLDYGGPSIDKDFPKTYETRAERRFWVREEFDNKVKERFVFLSAMYDLEKNRNNHFQLQKLDNYGLYLVLNNHLTISQFIKWANKTELHQ